MKPLIEELYPGYKAPLETDICGKELAELFVTLPPVLLPIVLGYHLVILAIIKTKNIIIIKFTAL
jgi:ABC-type molybdate transport system permease subunit